jgi:hypothetical protein
LAIAVDVIEALNISEFNKAQQVTLASIIPDTKTGGIWAISPPP